MPQQQRVVIYFGISVLLYWVLKLCFGRNRSLEQSPNNYFGLAAFILFFSLFPIVMKWGNKIPGSVFERSSYSGNYYAVLYKDTKGSDAEKAVVNIETDPDTGTYRLRRLMLQDGKRITFEEEEDIELKLDKVVNVHNHNNLHGPWDTWGVVLLDIPAEH